MCRLVKAVRDIYPIFGCQCRKRFVSGIPEFWQQKPREFRRKTVNCCGKQVDVFLPPVFFARLHLQDVLCKQLKGNRSIPRFSGCQLVGVVQYSWKLKHFRVITMFSKHASLVLDGQNVLVVNHDDGRVRQKDLLDDPEWDNYILAYKNWSSKLNERVQNTRIKWNQYPRILVGGTKHKRKKLNQRERSDDRNSLESQLTLQSFGFSQRKISVQFVKGRHKVVFMGIDQFDQVMANRVLFKRMVSANIILATGPIKNIVGEFYPVGSRIKDKQAHILIHHESCCMVRFCSKVRVSALVARGRTKGKMLVVCMNLSHMSGVQKLHQWGQIQKDIKRFVEEEGGELKDVLIGGNFGRKWDDFEFQAANSYWLNPIIRQWSKLRMLSLKGLIKLFLDILWLLYQNNSLHTLFLFLIAELYHTAKSISSIVQTRYTCIVGNFSKFQQLAIWHFILHSVIAQVGANQYFRLLHEPAQIQFPIDILQIIRASKGILYIS